MSSEGTAYFPESLAGRSTTGVGTVGTRPNDAASAFGQKSIFRSDESLLTSIGQGSKEALAILFRKHRQTVLNIAENILKDSSEAEDLSQEVFLLIFQKARSFDPSKATGSSWIVQIAYSRALNRRKYLNTRQHYTSMELIEDNLEPNRPLPILDEVLARLLLERLRDEISAEQQQTLELHLFEGYSLREIAEKTGQTLGNVRNHYYRGLVRLRDIVFSQKDS